MTPRSVFFDYAATTRCSEAAAEALLRYTTSDFGNPSSGHEYGQKAATVIWRARQFFSGVFGVSGDQIIFTGGGTESDNLAIQGVAFAHLTTRLSQPEHYKNKPAPRILTSVMEHPAVRKTALSLQDFGFDVQLIPVNSQGQIDRAAYTQLLTPETVLVSIQQVNNIIGSILPVEELAREAKRRVPGVIFHTDAVQAFTKVPSPSAHSGTAVDLVSISAHKIEGPKGIGALIVNHPDLLKSSKLRPLIWGGSQESGYRSGTQNAGLIAAFHVAAEQALGAREENFQKISILQSLFKKRLIETGLLPDHLHWNSPSEQVVPHIVSVSASRCPGGPLSRFLEDEGYMISTGSACSTGKPEPDAVLQAIGLKPDLTGGAIRISFSTSNTSEEVEGLVSAFQRSIQRVTLLHGKSARK